MSARPRLVRLHDGLRSRVRAALRPVRYRALVLSAAVRRRRMPAAVVVGITGSGGKTTAKDLIVAALGRRGLVRSHRTSLNRTETVARTILGAGSSWAVVQELGANGPDSLDAPLRLLRPNVAVVTSVQLDHFRGFRTREAVAAEKGKLVEALPPQGLAVLNADDPLVAAMAARTRARVVTYGLDPGADVRGEHVRGAWPERMSLTVHAGGRTAAVGTRLCGRHWASVVLGALAAATALGVPLEEAVDAIGGVEPDTGRMSPVEVPGGPTFVRDDWKAPLTSIDDVLAFLAEARAGRKVLVVGTLSDYGGDAARKYRVVARRALAVADEVIFVGRWSGRVLPVAKEAPPGTLHAFPTVRAATGHLRATLGAGDLVLLKGSATADHLGRIALAFQGAIACWAERCGRRRLCEACALRMVPSGSVSTA